MPCSDCRSRVDQRRVGWSPGRLPALQSALFSAASWQSNSLAVKRVTDLIRLSRAVFAAGDPRAKQKKCVQPASIIWIACLLLINGSAWSSPADSPSSPVVHRRRLDPAGGRTGFRLQTAAETGVHFTNRVASSRHLTNQIVLNGSGVAAGDFDGDGRCDLYFCGVDGPNALYRNLGNWRFVDVAESAGVAGAVV